MSLFYGMCDLQVSRCEVTYELTSPALRGTLIDELEVFSCHQKQVIEYR